MLTIIAFTPCLLFILTVIIRFLHKVWWTPIRTQNFMASQGIKGPSYKFLHGNTKEIINMKKKSMSTPMDLLRHDHVFPRVHPHIYSWINIYGKNFLNWHGPQAQLFITELELVKEVLNNKDGTYMKRKLKGYRKNLFGDGLAICEGKKWLKLRKLANHAFHVESMKGMVPAMIASVEEMLERWKHHEGKEIEVYQEFKILSAQVISRTAFGSSYLEGKIIFEMLNKLGVIICRNELNIRFPGVGKVFRSRDDIEVEKIEQTIRGSIIGLIEKREKKVMRGEEKSFGSDYLGSLIKVHHDANESKRISIDEMIDECKTFYLGGQETTNVLLGWIIFLLATHIDWQEKARNEVLELFGHENPSLEGISKLKTMSMIINETLRLYAPIGNLSRTASREVKLGKLTIPADMEIHIPIIALHHSRDVWGQDSHLFKPDRFEDGVARATNNNIVAFTPFGFGPRFCVGFNFTTNETKIALSMILQRYMWTLSPTYIHSPIQILTLQPKFGIQVILNAL